MLDPAFRRNHKIAPEGQNPNHRPSQWLVTVMYEREKIGLIQIANLRKNNDYAMWLQAIEKSNAYRLPECLSYYIKHDGSVSSGSKTKLIKWHYKLFKDGLGKNPVVSGILTANNLVHGVWKKIHYKVPVNE